MAFTWWTLANYYYTGKKKAHTHKLFCPVGLGTTPGLSRGFHRVCPCDKSGENLGQTRVFSLFYTVEARFHRVCPRDKPGLSLGQSWGRRAAQKVYVKKVYVPLSLAIHRQFLGILGVRNFPWHLQPDDLQRKGAFARHLLIELSCLEFSFFRMHGVSRAFCQMYAACCGFESLPQPLQHQFRKQAGSRVISRILPRFSIENGISTPIIEDLASKSPSKTARNRSSGPKMGFFTTRFLLQSVAKRITHTHFSMRFFAGAPSQKLHVGRFGSVSVLFGCVSGPSWGVGSGRGGVVERECCKGKEYH